MIEIKRRAPSVTPAFSDAIPPLLQRLYANRGLQTDSELNRSVAGLHQYQALTGIDAAVQLLANALASHQSILIVGDFDADGATSSALSVRACV